MSGQVRTAPSGTERTFPVDEIIVSKTDLKGRITYVNDVFCDVSGYSEGEVIGQPHSIVRHPDMPRCVFKLLWDEILAGREVFAYVNNLARNGDNYWVFAHVTPHTDSGGAISGFHSNRRVPDARALAEIKPIYRALRGIETSAADPKSGLEKSAAALARAVSDAGFDSYNRFIFAMTLKKGGAP